MPREDESDNEPTEFAGQDPEYQPKSMAETPSGKRVIILGYEKEMGLYIVTNFDSEGSVDTGGITTHQYRISPGKLRLVS